MSRSIYTVSSLVHYLKETIDHDMNIQSILIKGEISNFTNHRSGHWYFTLKDARAKLNCVMFASYASRCKILLKEGMQVIVQASMSVYEAQGNVQLYVTNVQIDGLGDLFLQYEQLKKKLAAEGLFDVTHKKSLPAYPEHIVLISAKEGAAVQDMKNTLARRWPIAKVSFLPSLVQGKEAAADLLKNLKQADAMHPDVILLARGGGAIEDLWCFNDETLARCIFACQSVVVSGVGHETDTTLVDYVSDARAATPTAAAELVTPDIEDVKHLLHIQKRRMTSRMMVQLNEAKTRMQQIHLHRYIKDPLSYIRDAQMNLAMATKGLERVQNKIQASHAQLDVLCQRMLLRTQSIRSENQKILSAHETALVHGLKQYESEQKKRFTASCSLLDAFSPLKILSRGYGVIYGEDHILKSVQEIKAKESLKIRMADGVVHTQVIQKEEF